MATALVALPVVASAGGRAAGGGAGGWGVFWEVCAAGFAGGSVDDGGSVGVVVGLVGCCC